MEAIFLQPVLQEKIWGGEKLQTHFGLDIPSKNTGEAWVISAHPNGVSTIISPQAYAGLGLDELYEREPELFGPHHPEPFPLLTKILDATSELSVQVHPDDQYAKEHVGPNELGKTECWYIIDAEPGASIVYGHNAQDLNEFNQRIQDNEWDKLLREVPVRAGDFFDVPAGTIHAIGAGVTVLETQQSSDTTYRVYDFDRKDDQGNTRELHIKESGDVTLFPHQDSAYNRHVSGDEAVVHLMTNEYFTVYKIQVAGEVTVDLTGDYHLFTVISGQGTMNIAGKVYDLQLASSFILPYGIKSVTFNGDLEMIMSHPNFAS